MSRYVTSIATERPFSERQVLNVRAGPQTQLQAMLHAVYSTMDTQSSSSSLLSADSSSSSAPAAPVSSSAPATSTIGFGFLGQIGRLGRCFLGIPCAMSVVFSSYHSLTTSWWPALICLHSASATSFATFRLDRSVRRFSLAWAFASRAVSYSSSWAISCW